MKRILLALLVLCGVGLQAQGPVVVPVGTPSWILGAQTAYLTSAATTNATLVSAVPGNVYHYSLINTTATIYYLRMYNLGAAPTCSSATGFVESIPIPASTAGAGCATDADCRAGLFDGDRVLLDGNWRIDWQHGSGDRRVSHYSVPKPMKAILTLLVLWLATGRADAATLYAKAAGGNWSDASTWSTTGSGGMDNSGPPTRTDDAILEAGSGNVVLDGVSLEALSVSMTSGTGDYAGTLSAANGGVDIGLVLFRNTTGTAWSASAASTIDIGVTLLGMTVIGSGETVTFAGGSKDYGSFNLPQTQASTFAITGSNGFFNISLISFLGAGDPTVQLQAGTTTTIRNLTVAVVGAHFFTIASSSAGMPATLSKANGVINVDNLVIVDNVASGGATWCDAYASADGGGNTGWSFAACPYEPLQSLTGVGR